MGVGAQNFLQDDNKYGEKRTTFGSKMVIFPARNATYIYKICEIHRAIFSSFYNIL